MAKTENVTTVLELKKECKSVARYDNPDEDSEVGKGFYLHNKSYEQLGKPKRIKISIQAYTETKS